MNTTQFVEAFAAGTLKDGQHSASLRVEITAAGSRILFNYATPIALINPGVDGVPGITAVAAGKYSATTNKHLTRVRRAVGYPFHGERPIGTTGAKNIGQDLVRGWNSEDSSFDYWYA